MKDAVKNASYLTVMRGANTQGCMITLQRIKYPGYPQLLSDVYKELILYNPEQPRYFIICEHPGGSNGPIRFMTGIFENQLRRLLEMEI